MDAVDVVANVMGLAVDVETAVPDGVEGVAVVPDADGDGRRVAEVGGGSTHGDPRDVEDEATSTANDVWVPGSEPPRRASDSDPESLPDRSKRGYRLPGPGRESAAKAAAIGTPAERGSPTVAASTPAAQLS